MRRTFDNFADACLNVAESEEARAERARFMTHLIGERLLAGIFGGPKLGENVDR